MKQQNFKFLLTLLISMMGIETFAHDIAVANADGKIIFYKWTNNNTELSVSYRGDKHDSYSNEYTGNVVIPESVTYNDATYPVTSIGSCAFDGCSSLTSVTIGNSVTSIGSCTFYNCSGLTSVTIPNSVTSIEDYAFCNSSGLTSVTIPNSVTSIEANAFSGCSGLTSITIPNSVTSIEVNAFAACSGLTSVTIGNSVTSIGNSAFSGCSGLTSITIPNSVTSIGNSAFYGCSGLKEVHISDLAAWCIISFSDNPLSYAHHLFLNGDEITELTIPNSVTSIGNYAFYGCSGLTSVIIPNSVTSIGNYAFSGCSGLTSIEIPNSVTSIGSSAFRECYNLLSVVVGNGVTSLPAYVFGTGTNLKSLTIGSGVVAIDEKAFAYTVTSGWYSENTTSYRPYKTIWLTNTPPEGYANAAGTVNYVSNDQYTQLSNKTVYSFLSSIFEVDGIRYVPVSPSERTCDAIDCVYDETAKNVQLLPSVTYKNVTLAVQDYKPYLFCNNKYVETAKIGNSVSALHRNLFQGCSNLQNMIIPKTVGAIEDYVFAGCQSLNTLVIDDRDTELTLGSNGSSPMFADCPLDSVYIGGNITYNTGSNYGYSPFYRNTTLRTVVITDEETEISDNEFYGCTNLQSFKVGDGVTTFGNWAFSGCSSLSSLSFGSHLQTIGQEAFSDCASVTDIVSRTTTPPVCSTQALDDINKWTCTLHVPEGTLAAYQGADQWKEFFFVVEQDDGGDIPQEDNLALTIGEAGIATYSPRTDVDFTTLTDVKAYIGSGFNRETGVLTMTRVYDVPAGTGLLVKGAAGTYEVPESPSASIYSNLLRGVTVGRKLSATTGGYANYVLGSGSNGTGFYRVPAEGTTLTAGRAYLSIPAETAASRSTLRVVFDDEEEATAISDVDRQEGEAAVYDLQGRRVAQSQRGLYISNGKKVVVK